MPCDTTWHIEFSRYFGKIHLKNRPMHHHAFFLHNTDLVVQSDIEMTEEQQDEPEIKQLVDQRMEEDNETTATQLCEIILIEKV